MRNSVLLILLIFLLWGAGSLYWYVCKIKGLCDESGDTIAAAADPPRTGNLTFIFQGTEPNTDEQTAVTIDSIKALEIDTLLITGIYYQGETATTARSRAQRIQSLLGAANFNKPITLQTAFRNSRAQGDFIAHEFAAIRNTPIDQEDTSDLSQSAFTVVKTADKITIFFPLASADPHTSKTLINDLKQLAQQAIAGKKELQVVGHTDNSGTPQINMQYGRQRADAIKAILIEYGVAAGQITATSKGQTEPIAANDSEEGRRKNRRVEIITITN